MPGHVSRRALLGGGAAAAGVAGAFVVGRASEGQGSPGEPATRPASYAFRGEHQAGIVTPAQDRLHFAAFDVTTDDRDQLVALLQQWTEAAERMTAGKPAGPVGPVEGPSNPPPDDTGEAIGLPPSGLTITFGFGPSLFRTDDGKDRFGLADRQPEALRTLPHFPADALDPARSYGDLCIQACADDPQVAVHAIRNLARIGFGTVSVRWSQLGFGRTSTTSTSQSTPRNLFGFKDGTANIKAEETSDVEEHVWVAAGDDPKAELAGRRLLPRRPAVQHDHRGLGPAVARRPGGVRRPHQGHRCTAVRRHRVHRARLRHAGQQRPHGHRPRRARPPGPPGLQRRRPDAAPRLQLRRRQQLARRPRRRAVLPRVRPQPGHPLHPDPEQDGVPGRADGVPQGQRLRALRRTPGHRPRASTSVRRCSPELQRQRPVHPDRPRGTPGRG